MYDKRCFNLPFPPESPKFGQFTLASGKQATYYLDGKQVTLDAHGGGWWPKASWTSWRRPGHCPAAVGGMSIGADPITAAVVTMSAVRGTPVTGFMAARKPRATARAGTSKVLSNPAATW